MPVLLTSSTPKKRPSEFEKVFREFEKVFREFENLFRPFQDFALFYWASHDFLPAVKGKDVSLLPLHGTAALRPSAHGGPVWKNLPVSGLPKNGQNEDKKFARLLD